jgi:transposase
VVDVFVDAVDMRSFGYTHTACTEAGRPAYHPSALMKLYLYGYRHGIRSSRKLQREAKTNMEAIWLLKGLSPHYKTIANFRKDNPGAFREVFRKFVLLLRDWDLIEGQTVAIDSFKIRASNSLKGNFNEAKLKRHLAYIDDQIDQYQAQLDAADTQEENLVRCVQILGMDNFAKALIQRLYVILDLKSGSFWSHMRNFLFLLPKNIARMSAA